MPTKKKTPGKASKKITNKQIFNRLQKLKLKVVGIGMALEMLEEGDLKGTKKRYAELKAVSLGVLKGMHDITKKLN